MSPSGERVRATWLCLLCDFKFVDEVVARYPEPAMPDGFAYIELRHLDRNQLAALASRPDACGPLSPPAPARAGSPSRR